MFLRNHKAMAEELKTAMNDFVPLVQTLFSDKKVRRRLSSITSLAHLATKLSLESAQHSSFELRRNGVHRNSN